MNSAPAPRKSPRSLPLRSTQRIIKTNADATPQRVRGALAVAGDEAGRALGQVDDRHEVDPTDEGAGALADEKAGGGPEKTRRRGAQAHTRRGNDRVDLGVAMYLLGSPFGWIWGSAAACASQE